MNLFPIHLNSNSSMGLRRDDLRKTEPKVIGKSNCIIRIARVITKPNSAVRSTMLHEKVYSAGFDLWAEMAHEALDGPCCRITQSTDCAAFNLFSVTEI